MTHRSTDQYRPLDSQVDYGSEEGMADSLPLPPPPPSNLLGSAIKYSALSPSASLPPPPPPPPPPPSFADDVIERTRRDLAYSPPTGVSPRSEHDVRQEKTASSLRQTVDSDTEAPSTRPGSLFEQIQAGIHLRTTSAGLKIREVVTEQDYVTKPGGSISEETTLKTAETSSTSSDMSASRQQYSYRSTSDITIDVTRLPGYQEVPPNCPTWKQAMIEKKNKQLEEDYIRELTARKMEEDRWLGIPEWKKSLILEKEKKKHNEMVPHQLEYQKRAQEMERLQALPEWKRNLIIKKRGNDA